MAGRVMPSSVYSFRKDHDSRGEYYWIISPSGREVAYVDTLDMALALLEHLNRNR